MIDFIQHFKNKVQELNPILSRFDYVLCKENKKDSIGSDKVTSYEFDFLNENINIKLSIDITRYVDQTYLLSMYLFNKKQNVETYTWDTFNLKEFIKDNNLQDQFIYKIQGDEQVKEFIDQYFKNLEFALNDYLKPYVTGAKYIDHYQRMRDQFYEYTSFEQEEKKIIKEHLAKQGKMAVFRQMVIGLKQDARNYMDKVKNFFLPPNQR